MKINIKATNIELTLAISAYAEKKIRTLKKFLDVPDAVAQVEVGKSTKHHKSGEVFRAEVHLVAPGMDLYAVSDQSDLYAAIDLVKDELIEKLTREKGKREALYRRGARKVKDIMKGLNFFRRK